MTPEEIEREQEMEREVERRLQERLRAMQLPATTQAGDGTAVVDGQNATALAARAVSAEQAGFIITGDNNHVTLLIDHIQRFTPFTAEQLRAEIGRYLHTVLTHNRTITLRGVQHHGRNVIELDLDTIYVPLAATVTAAPHQRGHRQLERELEETQRNIPLTAVLSQGQRLIITGGPGSGKTTVLMHIAWVLAEAIGRDNAPLAREKIGLAGTLPLPILIPINRYAHYLRHAQPHDPHQRTLSAFLSHYLITRQNTPTADFFRHLLQQGQNIILLLDGLDEVPTETEREQVSQAIEDLVIAHPALRVVVTCRTAAYKGRAALGQAFREIQVQPLEESHITTLIQQAYRAVHPHDPTHQKQLADDLLAGIAHMEQERQNRLGKGAERLVNSPLLVRMLLLVHLSERRLPQQRAELYSKAINNLILPDHGLDAQVRDELSQLVGDPIKHLEVVQMLAFHMHQQGATQGRDIDEPDLRRLLAKQPAFQDLPDKLIATTRQRGTLLEERLGTYRFVHLAFQEFLVARHLMEALLFEQKLPQFIRQNNCLTDSWWREPLLLLAGYLSFNFTRPAEKYIRYLAGLDGRDLSPESLTNQWAGTELAGTAVLEWPSAPAELRRDIAQRLADLVMAGGEKEVSARLRANLGMVLGQLGDPRRGVGIVVREDGSKIPDIVWGKVVPASKYTIGGDKKAHRSFEAQEVTITESYQLAKYPVTYAQFQCFVEAEDFSDARWWAGMPEHDGSKPTQTLGEQAFPYPNHPRERVSWYQAVAFCRWLSDKLNDKSYEVRLPHEHEWEVAAQYNDGRTYPWGNEFDKDKANTNASGLRQTTAVGLYPNGRQPHLDLYDLSGNVREWCQNKYKDPTQAEVDASGDSRGLRGGSWDYHVSGARAAFRSNHYPCNRNGFVGLRVVRVPRPPSLLGH